MPVRPARALIAALALVLLPPTAAAQDAAEHETTLSWRLDHLDFGGLSAIDLAPDGRAFVALTDRGRLIRGRLSRDGDRLTGVGVIDIARLPPVATPGGEMKRPDSEGVDLAADGTVTVAHEGAHNVARLSADGQRLAPYPYIAGARGLPANAGLESVALAADGTVYTVPEVKGRAPVYRFADGGWRVAFALPDGGDYMPTGADIGPDGRLYLLERVFNGLLFRSRLRRIDLRTGETETVFATRLGRHGNLEGVSVWRGEDGRLRALMVSDNNFLPVVDTQLVEYVLPD